MNKLYLCLIFMVAITSSCQKELSFDGAGTGPTDNLVCLTCDYMPMCDSTRLNYVDSMAGTGTNRSFVYDVTADTVINGAVFKKIKEVGSGQSTYMNCDGNVISNFIATGTSMGGAVITNYMQIALKANEAVGATWQDQFVVNGLTTVSRYQIIEKNITRQVFDSTYTNVIYVRDTMVTVVPLLGETILAVRKNYIARGVGLIESVSEQIDPFTGNGIPFFIRKLKSYRIR
ncbi:MAG: hypothetical protein WAT19_05630 [Ferruginibacter sp.]